MSLLLSLLRKAMNFLVSYHAIEKRLIFSADPLGSALWEQGSPSPTAFRGIFHGVAMAQKMIFVSPFGLASQAFRGAVESELR